MHAQTYFQEVVKVAQSIDLASVERLATELAALRERGGRLFFLGVGGSAGNCANEDSSGMERIVPHGGPGRLDACQVEARSARAFRPGAPAARR